MRFPIQTRPPRLTALLAAAVLLTSTVAGGSGVFGIWTAGMPPYVFPDGTGRVLGPGTTITIDSHYHPFGEATSDETQIGIFFGEGELEREVATVSVANTGIRIPPGADHHPEEGFYQPDEAMQILAFSPHMHVRGKAMTPPHEGEGVLYLVSGLQMFTITLDDIAWSGNRLQVNTQFPTPEASAITTVIDGELDADGALQGTITIGTGSERPMQMKMVGQPVGRAASTNATAATAGE